MNGAFCQRVKCCNYSFAPSQNGTNHLIHLFLPFALVFIGINKMTRVWKAAILLVCAKKLSGNNHLSLLKMHKNEMVMERKVVLTCSSAVVQPSLGAGLSTTTLDFCAPVESISLLSF